MKFRDPKTGNVYDNIVAAWKHWDCPGRNDGSCRKICSFRETVCSHRWAEKFPLKASKLMGYEIVEESGAGGIIDTGNRTPMGDTGFVRDTHEGKGRMDLLPWPAIIELSKHCEVGALKYGERNIDMGAPLHSLLDSGARHLAKLMSGQTDEDHLRAACWNLMWALNQRTTHPELNDTPWKGEQNG